MRLFPFVVLILALPEFGSAAANAEAAGQALTVGGLLDACAPSSAPADQAVCDFLILNALAEARSTAKETHESDLTLCIPRPGAAEIFPTWYKESILAWLEAHSEFRDLDAFRGLVVATDVVYDCKRSPPQ